MAFAGLGLLVGWHSSSSTCRFIYRQYSEALIFFAYSLEICLAIGIEELLASLGPCGFELRLCDIPIRPAFHKNSTEILAKFVQSRPREEPVANVDLINDKP